VGQVDIDQGAPRIARRKVLIIGHGESGKDLAASMLADFGGFRVASSSEFAARLAVFPLVSDLYPDWRACFDDRRAHRPLWFHAIAAFNCRPGACLAEMILRDHDVYTGMRNRAEFDQARHLFDDVLWVDRSEVVGPEAVTSMQLTADDADAVIDNNGCIDNLEARLLEFFTG
jgi:hypothetical protein